MAATTVPSLDLIDKLILGFEIIISIMASVGNGIIIVTIIRTTKLRTTTNFLVAGLAFSDFCIGAFGIPLHAWGEYGFSTFLCPGAYILLGTLTTFSVLTIFSIAAERFVAINYPFLYEKIATPFRVKMWILGIFITSVFGVATYPIIYAIALRTTPPRCVYTLNIPEAQGLPMFMLILIVTLTSACLNIKVLLVARRSARRIAPMSTEEKRANSKLRKETKAAIFLSFVIFYFAFSWIPLMLYLILEYKRSAFDELLFIGLALGLSNAAINPLIYAFGYKEYRTAVKNMCCSNGMLFQRTFSMEDSTQ